MQIRENIPLAAYTTLGIGGPARWFAEVSSEAGIVEAESWARQRGVPLFVLGGGSNLLVADAGFPGLVLHITLKGMELEGERLRCAAGEMWDACVQRAAEAGLAGVECLAGIPGTVGGTPVQNVGAYGQEVASVIEQVRAFDRKMRAFVELTAAKCGFGYRHSRFNTADRGRFLVTRVDYRLRAGGAPQLEYADVKSYFRDRAQTPTLIEVAAAVREIRRSKGMLLVEGDPNCRSAGSFFKNPVVKPEIAERVREFGANKGVPVRLFTVDGGLVKVPAAWLIEQAGFPKGFRIGAAGISSLHTLALVNRGGARAEEMMVLAQKIAATVETKFGVQLEIEPERVGF